MLRVTASAGAVDVKQETSPDFFGHGQPLGGAGCGQLAGRLAGHIG